MSMVVPERKFHVRGFNLGVSISVFLTALFVWHYSSTLDSAGDVVLQDYQNWLSVYAGVAVVLAAMGLVLSLRNYGEPEATVLSVVFIVIAVLALWRMNHFYWLEQSWMHQNPLNLHYPFTK